MKCANPNCNRGIGLVCHQRHSFDNCDSVQRNAATSSWTETETAPTGTSFHELLRVASVATDREFERASKFTRVPASAARLNL